MSAQTQAIFYDTPGSFANWRIFGIFKNDQNFHTYITLNWYQ